MPAPLSEPSQSSADALLLAIQSTLGVKAMDRALIKTCIVERLLAKFPHREPTPLEIEAEADAWLADFNQARLEFASRRDTDGDGRPKE